MYEKTPIDGKTGFVVKDNDIEELAKRIEELLNSQNLLVKMKENVKKMNKSKLVDINTLVVNAHTPVPFISDVLLGSVTIYHLY